MGKEQTGPSTNSVRQTKVMQRKQMNANFRMKKQKSLHSQMIRIQNRLVQYHTATASGTNSLGAIRESQISEMDKAASLRAGEKRFCLFLATRVFGNRRFDFLSNFISSSCQWIMSIRKYFELKYGVFCCSIHSLNDLQGCTTAKTHKITQLRDFPMIITSGID